MNLFSLLRINFLNVIMPDGPGATGPVEGEGTDIQMIIGAIFFGLTATGIILLVNKLIKNYKKNIARQSAILEELKKLNDSDTK